jgi:hypothetical protein
MEKNYTVRNFIIFYISANIIRVINSRRMKWAGYTPSMAEMGHAYNVSENLKGRTI